MVKKLLKFASDNKISVAAALSLGATGAFAVGPYDAISAGVDWTTVGAAIVGIAALKAAPLVVSVGSKMVLRMIGR